MWKLWTGLCIFHPPPTGFIFYQHLVNTTHLIEGYNFVPILFLGVVLATRHLRVLHSQFELKDGTPCSAFTSFTSSTFSFPLRNCNIFYTPWGVCICWFMLVCVCVTCLKRKYSQADIIVSISILRNVSVIKLSFE